MIIGCSIFSREIQNHTIDQKKLFIKGNVFDSLSIKLKGKNNLSNINAQLRNIEDDTIIIFDASRPQINTLKWIIEKNPNKRYIFYYWNPVNTGIHPQFIPKEYEKWSYSQYDCKKYGMQYNSTFYFDSLLDINQNTKSIHQDVFSICKNKGRKKTLIDLKNELDIMGITSKFIITATHPRIQRIGYQKALPYDEVLNQVCSSKALIDYYSDSYAGLSLRVMESIFFEKKLITNNETIYDYNFYEPENIFVLENDNINDLKEFINSPYKKIDKQIVDYYLFENWMKRFEE